MLPERPQVWQKGLEVGADQLLLRAQRDRWRRLMQLTELFICSQFAIAHIFEVKTLKWCFGIEWAAPNFLTFSVA